MGAPAYLVEVAAVGAAAVLLAARRPVWESLAYAWWMMLAIVLAFVDTATHRLPRRLTCPAAAGTTILLAVAATVGHAGPAWVRATAAGLGCATVLAALTLLLGRHGPGLGDARLILGIGLVLGWLGWAALAFGVFVAALLQGAWAVALLVSGRADRSSMLPMGPFLVTGAMIAIAVLG